MTENKNLCASHTVLFYASLMVLLISAMDVTHAAAPGKKLSPKVIDDFTDAKASPWEFVTDKAMGGKSTGKMTFVTHEERTTLHLTGSVSAKKKNNFIQVRRPFDPKKKYFNASGYDGLRLRVKGNSQTYAIHLKTSSTLFPWQHYQAEFKTDGTWQEVLIPFKDFKPKSLKRVVKASKLRTIALVAMTPNMKADVYIAEITLCHSADLNEAPARQE